MREPATGNVPHRVRAQAPTLHAVSRGRAADELVLIDSSGRAILLRGDGYTPEESVAMCERALALLGGPGA